MKRIGLLVAMMALLAVTGCESTDDARDPGDGRPLTYDEAVAQIRRPPTRSRQLPDGGLEATWETEVRGGKKLLIITFDPDRRMQTWREQFIR